MINVTKYMARTPQVIQNMLTKNIISAHTAHRMSTLFSHILRNSGSAAEADTEAERYFSGVDGRFRPFFASLLLLFLPLLIGAQTTFPTSRWECADSIKFQGDNMSLTVFPDSDSIVLVSPIGEMEFVEPTTFITAFGPATGNLYFCYVFESKFSMTVVEYYYNTNTKLWGICITYEDSVLTAGMPVVRPFPPLKKPKPKLKPVTAHR